MVRGNVVPAKSDQQFEDVCFPRQHYQKKTRFLYFSNHLLNIVIIVYQSKGFYKAENDTAKISIFVTKKMKMQSVFLYQMPHETRKRR